MMQLLDFEHDSEGNLTSLLVTYDGETIELERIRHAEWIPWEINGKETKLFMTCSGCKRYQWPRSEVPLFRRCPKCGARMDGGSKRD